jgi:hypothetical protein
LGFTTREDTHSLRALKAGEFYAFGPAISNEVRLIKVGNVKTTHLKAGQRAAPPTPPSDKVKKVLAQLANLPHEAEEEAKSINELRLQVKQLQNELRKARSQPALPPAPRVDAKAEKLIRDMQLDQTKRLEKLVGGAEALNERLIAQLDTFTTTARELRSSVLSAQTLSRSNDVRPIDPVLKGTAQALRNRERPAPRPAPRPVVETDNGTLPVGETAVLRALIQYPDGLHKKQLTVLTGYKRSTRDAYIARLRDKGYVTDSGEKVWASDIGVRAMPDAEPLPTGEALRDFWLDRLPEGERAILLALIESHPVDVNRDQLSESTGYKRSTRDAYLSRLAAKELVKDIGRGIVKVSDTLFEVDA